MRRKRPLAVVLSLMALVWWAQAGAVTREHVHNVTSNAPPVARLLGRSGGGASCQDAGSLPRSENVVAGFDGAYVNQIALSTEGSRQCGVASAAMVLATVGGLSPGYEAVAEKANELWQSYSNPTYVSRVAQMLSDNGVKVESACLAHDDAWAQLRGAIDCGAPGIVVSTRLTRSGSGHFLVAGGYRQEDGKRQILAYDPYGYWQGPEDGYLVNDDTPDSRLGEAVFYNFDEIWGYGSANCAGGYLLTIRP